MRGSLKCFVMEKMAFFSFSTQIRESFAVPGHNYRIVFSDF